MALDPFATYVLADVIGVVIALALYDYVVDELLDRILRKFRSRKSILERQSIT